ncbi:MAG: hypothetical protein R2838_19470 [Caldilineaceae bacterium]
MPGWPSMSQGIFVADDDLWTRFPGSRPLTASAGLPVEEWYHPAPPTDPDFRALRLAQVEAILTRVGHLTASGWTSSVGPRAGRSGRPLYHSSFDPVTLARFTADTGVTLPDAAPRVVGLDSRPRGRCVVGMALPANCRLRGGRGGLARPHPARRATGRFHHPLDRNRPGCAPGATGQHPHRGPRPRALAGARRRARPWFITGSAAVRRTGLRR